MLYFNQFITDLNVTAKLYFTLIIKYSNFVCNWQILFLRFLSVSYNLKIDLIKTYNKGNEAIVQPYLNTQLECG